MLHGQDFFKSRFVKTILELLFFKNDTNGDGKMQLREFTFSGFLENIDMLCAKTEIEKFHYFDYEHFYVFCYLFNELDDDEDGFISRSEIEKYSRHHITSMT